MIGFDRLASIGAAGLLACASFAAQASTVLFDNIGPASLNADCSFNTTCAAAFSRGNEFAAQFFSLGSSSTITDATYTVAAINAPASSVNWALYASGGSTPTGAALASGNSAVVTTNLTNISGYDINLISFSLPSVNLSAGNYYFAIQEVNASSNSYLEQGFLTIGAAETNDGGISWAPGYENSFNGSQLGGISVSLIGTTGGVPEPASWALMVGGFGMMGAALRRRRTAVAA